MLHTTGNLMTSETLGVFLESNDLIQRGVNSIFGLPLLVSWCTELREERFITILQHFLFRHARCKLSALVFMVYGIRTKPSTS